MKTIVSAGVAQNFQIDYVDFRGVRLCAENASDLVQSCKVNLTL